MGATWARRAFMGSHGRSAPSAVWRRGRLFFRCSECRRLLTRLYVPIAGLEPRCRRCWGLSYVSQSWSYKSVGFLGKALGPIAYVTTLARRNQRRGAAQARYAARRQALSPWQKV